MLTPVAFYTDDRSHVIERSVNRRSGEEERKQDFINIDESKVNFNLFQFVLCHNSTYYSSVN